MQECYIIRRGGSGAGSKVKPDFFKGLIQLDGEVNPEEPEIGQEVILEPYVSDIQVLYGFRNSNTEEDEFVTFDDGNTYSIPYVGKEYTIENIDGAGTDGYYESDGFKMVLRGEMDTEPSPAEDVSVEFRKYYQLGNVLVNDADTLLFFDMSRQFANSRIWRYKKNNGLALCIAFGIDEKQNLVILLSKDSIDAVDMYVRADQTSVVPIISKTSFFYNGEEYFLGITATGAQRQQAYAYDGISYHYGIHPLNNLVDSENNDLGIPSLGGLLFQIIDLFGHYLEEGEGGEGNNG